MKPLILYINPEFKKEESRVSPLMYPFWGESSHKTISFGGAFSKHMFDSSRYGITDNPDACDCHFLPFNFWGLEKKNPARINEAVLCAQQHNKKLLIDAFGDTMRPIDIPNSIILRFAQYRRFLTNRDIIVPAYIEDLLETHYQGHLTLRHKQKKPIVGFVGWGSFPFWKHVRSYIKEVPIFLWSLVQSSYGIFRKGVFLRSIALTSLAKNIHIQTKFLIRSSYSGNVRTAEKSLQDLRLEFVDNINSTDYTLCQKGDANQSTRFFEVVSVGRIPLIIDTECVFPLEEKISYKDFCVFVDYVHIKKIGDVLATFHAELLPEKFEDMQRQARRVYEKYLRIDSFTPFLVEEIRKSLLSST